MTIRGGGASGQALERVIPRRYSCIDSVLTLILNDQGGSDGLIMAASDRKLELFSVAKNTLSARLIDTSLTFIFIVPLYSSSDELILLQKTAEPESAGVE